MASTNHITSTRPLEGEVFVPRKKFKTSDLPLNSTQRSTIDSLLHTIKKKGEYDALRKKVWSQYAGSVSVKYMKPIISCLGYLAGRLTLEYVQDDKNTFTSLLNELAEAETDRDPSLLSRDRGKAATLMQGAVDRSDIYKSVELSLDKLIAAHIDHVQEAGREIRKAEIGEEAAAEEEKRGNKTDEDYAKESAARRVGREEARKKEEARKRREDEKERLRAEEKKKKLELEKLRSADERRREEEAKEAKREMERAALRAAAKQLEEEKEAERRERHERRKEEELERSRDVERSRHRTRSRSRDRLRSSHRESEPLTRHREPRSHATPTDTHQSSELSIPPPAVDEKALEAAALELLLREGRELAAKNTTLNPPTRSESIEAPLPRKPHLSSRTPGTPKTEPHPGPKLSFSTTNVPFTHSSRLKSPHHSHRHRSRDRSPSRHHHHHRSRSRSASQRHSARHDLSPDAKAAWKAKASAQRERDAEAYKRARSRSPTHDRDYHHHESSHRYTRSPSRERGGERERSGRHERERHERGADRYAQRRTRDKSPVEIDRYVPSGGSTRVTTSGRDRERERAHREGGREGRERDGGWDREGARERYVEIDRYVPGRADGDGSGSRRGRGER